MSYQGHYAVLQYSPAPERLEFVNIGILVVNFENAQYALKFSRNLNRVDRVFGRQSRSYLNALIRGTSNRIKLEISRVNSIEHFEHFSKSRANEIRISRLLPILINDLNVDADNLLQLLVASGHHVSPDDATDQSRLRVATKLKMAFQSAGVEGYLRHPEPIELPDFGVTITAPYAYKNGRFNLIAPVSFRSTPENAFKEASKRAIQGRWVSRMSARSSIPKHLVVVGDFPDDKDSPLYGAVDAMMTDHDVTLYGFSNLNPLLEDIRIHRPISSIDALVE